MTKRLRSNKDDMEIQALKNHLDKQDKILQSLKENVERQDKTLQGLKDSDGILEKTMNQILDLLKGSFVTDSKGLIQNMKEMRESSGKLVDDVKVLHHWKKSLEDSKGTLTIRFSVLFTRFLAVIGGLGTIVAIALGIKELLEK